MAKLVSRKTDGKIRSASAFVACGRIGVSSSRDHHLKPTALTLRLEGEARTYFLELSREEVEQIVKHWTT